MYFLFRNHQHKGKAYLIALNRSGHKQIHRPERAEFVMTDLTHRGIFSGNGVEPDRLIVGAEKYGIPIFMYPHSSRPNIPFDLVDSHYEGVRKYFTIAEGHREVLERIGYPCPVEVMGWSYSEIKPFQGVMPKDKIRVLFAPSHPVGGGFLPEVDRELNANVYRTLLSLIPEIDLTVRHAYGLELNGLWRDSRVHYRSASLNGDTSDMGFVDVVVAGYTYAYLAVALGKPLVMSGEIDRPHSTPMNGNPIKFALKWEKYREYMEFPYNIEPNFGSKERAKKVLVQAIENEPREWKRLFIGEKFDGKKFVKVLEDSI